MGEDKRAKKNTLGNPSRSDHASLRTRVNPLLKSEEIVDLRDISSEIEKVVGKKAVTNEQRALQALGRLFTSKSSVKSPKGSKHFNQPPAHLPVPCQAMQAAAHPKETDLVPWTNWGIIDSQTVQLGSCSIRKMFAPTSSYEIASAISQAEADGRTLRALGSGWSFSDAVLPQESDVDESQRFELATGSPPVSSHFGYAVQPNGFTANLQYLLPSILRANENVASLFFVEAGIKLHDLNYLLNCQAPPVALKTMGGSDGQSLAGAISTGVHGSDYDRPPLADSVRAIYLIGAGGTHHWIEPASRRITDLARLISTHPCLTAANCHYDDAMFEAALVSMGSMGVIYAVILDVVEQHVLIQFNMWSTWENILADSGRFVPRAGQWGADHQLFRWVLQKPPMGTIPLREIAADPDQPDPERRRHTRLLYVDSL